MAHNLAQGRTPTISDSTDFIRKIHILLSDVASHITQIRSDNICRDAGLPTLRLNAISDNEDALLDTAHVLEQSKLTKALQDAQTKGHLSRKKKSKCNFSSTKTATTKSTHQSARPVDTLNLSGPILWPTKPSTLRASPSSSSNSRGFQRR